MIFAIFVYMWYSFCLCCYVSVVVVCFFFQAEDGIRDLVRSRGLGDVYKRQSGMRLGMGGGFYDRAFAFRRQRPAPSRPRLIGIALSLIHI